MRVDITQDLAQLGNIDWLGQDSEEANFEATRLCGLVNIGRQRHAARFASQRARLDAFKGFETVHD